MTKSVSPIICFPVLGIDILVNYVIVHSGVMTSLSKIGLLAFVFPVLSTTVDQAKCSTTFMLEINMSTISINLKIIEGLSTVVNVAVGKVAP